MATFLQWHRLHFDQTEHKRVYWLCGPERRLVEETIDAIRARVAPHDMEYAYLQAGSVKDKEIWAHANQYPMDPMAKRLVLVREAEKIKAWDPFTDWIDSRHIPQVTLIFISNEIDFDSEKGHIARIAKSGRLVKCGPLNEGDAVAYLRLRMPTLDTALAKMLLARVGGDVSVAANCLDKCKYLTSVADERTLKALTTPSPAERFVSSLIAMKKIEALEAAAATAPDDYSMQVGSLDYRLEMLSVLNRAMRRHQSLRDMPLLKDKQWLIKELQPHARFYDRQRVERCVGVLALVDSALQRGERTGVLETLVANW